MANSYSYDEYGNRTGAVLGGTAVSYTYDKNNRLTKESATAGGTTTDVLYQYDPNGNRVSVVTSSVTTEQAGTAGISLELPQLETALNRYDAFGRLVESEITKDGARTLAQYTYNASGYRTSKTVNGVTTEHVLDGANVAADVANGQVTQYVRGLGLTALVQADGTRLQYVTDGHGDVTKLISGSGAVVVDYTYDAFGNQTEEAEDSNPFRYDGEYWDSESGLIYLRARYYDSGVGVFTSEDTHWNVGNMIYGDDNTGIPSIAAILQSGNLYLYCMGNPVNCFDPTGRVAYEHFETAVQAAEDWAWNYYGRTDYTLFEFGSLIYMGYEADGTPYFAYTWGAIGTPHTVDCTEMIEMVPEGTTVVGNVHSHPNGRNFSTDDIDNMKARGYDYSFVIVPTDDRAVVQIMGVTKENLTPYGYGFVRYNPLTVFDEVRLFNRFNSEWHEHYNSAYSPWCDQYNCRYREWPRR